MANTTTKNELWIIGPGNKDAQANLNLSTWFTPTPTCQLSATDNGYWASTFEILTMANGTTGPTNRLVSRMLVDTNGNVGINTKTPQATLDVNGTLKASTLTAGVLTVPKNPNAPNPPNVPNPQPGQILWDTSSIWIYTGKWEKAQLGELLR